MRTAYGGERGAEKAFAPTRGRVCLRGRVASARTHTCRVLTLGRGDDHVSAFVPFRRMFCAARRILIATLVVTGAAAQPATAQDPPAEHHHEAPPAPTGWQWSSDANVFFGQNYQQRHFADFSSWESQNWFMLAGDRPVGRNHFAFQVMLSLEPFTLDAHGSPQLFQTGESYQRTPLVNLQHPHDLLMGAGVTYRMARAGIKYSFGADLVGSPTLGPTAFMHRESARDNPQVPLTHHHIDSTHITPGVLRAGADIGSFTLETSVFRGEEPNEDRLDIEKPRLDSWAARVGWHHGPWQAQVSGGHLEQPEWFEPYNVTRLTASIAYDGQLRGHTLRATAAWGENREFNGFNGNNDGYFLEWDLSATRASTIYGRAEVADKELFGLGFHPPGQAHRHVYYKIRALTVGYLRDLPYQRWGRLGVGADATVYGIPDDLLVFWASSHSYHVFLRWRPRVSMTHVH